MNWYRKWFSTVRVEEDCCRPFINYYKAKEEVMKPNHQVGDVVHLQATGLVTGVRKRVDGGFKYDVEVGYDEILGVPGAILIEEQKEDNA